jgi:hypothetical protein
VLKVRSVLSLKGARRLLHCSHPTQELGAVIVEEPPDEDGQEE